MNAENSRWDEALTAAVNRGGPGAGDGPAAVMRVVAAMPPPFVPEREASFIYKSCTTVYYGLVFGLMAAAGWFILSSPAAAAAGGVFDTDLLPASGGALAVIAGSIFILLQGREVNTWLTVLLARGRVSLQPSFESVCMLTAGVGFCVWGGLMFMSGLL